MNLETQTGRDIHAKLSMNLATQIGNFHFSINLRFQIGHEIHAKIALIVKPN